VLCDLVQFVEEVFEAVALAVAVAADVGGFQVVEGFFEGFDSLFEWFFQPWSVEYKVGHLLPLIINRRSLFNGRQALTKLPPANPKFPIQLSLGPPPGEKVREVKRIAIPRIHPSASPIHPNAI
jgi:hypothetical protein